MAWTPVVASRVAVNWHRGRRRHENLRRRLVALRAPGVAETQPDRNRDLALVVAGLPPKTATARRLWNRPAVLAVAAAAVGVALAGGFLLNKPDDPADDSDSRSLPGWWHEPRPSPRGPCGR